MVWYQYPVDPVLTGTKFLKYRCKISTKTLKWIALIHVLLWWSLKELHNKSFYSFIHCFTSNVLLILSYIKNSFILKITHSKLDDCHMVTNWTRYSCHMKQVCVWFAKHNYVLVMLGDLTSIVMHGCSSKHLLYNAIK